MPDELDVNENGDEEDAPKKVKRELWRSEDQGLAGEYEYVMYGKVDSSFEYRSIETDKVRFTNSMIR
jgi:hypothetical protein